MTAEVDVEKCTGCGLCVEACPVESITIDNDKAKVNEETCVGCGVCVGECPNTAISIK